MKWGNGYGENDMKEYSNFTGVDDSYMRNGAFTMFGYVECVFGGTQYFQSR